MTENSENQIIPGSDEYNQEMAKLGEQVQTTGFTPNGDVSYQNTPSDKTEEPPKEEPPKTEEPPKEEPPKTEEPPKEEPPKTEADSKLDIPALELEFQEKGELSKESYEKLEKAGLSKDIVDAYIAGQQALTNQFYQVAYDLVGGKENYSNMITWASQSLSEAERNAFNVSVSSRDPNISQLAIKGLEAKYIAANGVQPAKLLSGGANPTSASSGFQSHAQITDAINDPRYRSDPAYRREVEARIASTPDNFFLARQGIS